MTNTTLSVSTNIMSFGEVFSREIIGPDYINFELACPDSFFSSTGGFLVMYGYSYSRTAPALEHELSYAVVDIYYNEETAMEAALTIQERFKNGSTVIDANGAPVVNLNVDAIKYYPTLKVYVKFVVVDDKKNTLVLSAKTVKRF